MKYMNSSHERLPGLISDYINYNNIYCIILYNILYYISHINRMQVL